MSDLADVLHQLAELCKLPSLAGDGSQTLRFQIPCEGRLLTVILAPAEDRLRPGEAKGLPAAPASKPTIEVGDAHRRLLKMAPVGEENRVKASTLIRLAGFPKPNSYNRRLVTVLVHEGLLLRAPDQKVYRPSERGQA